MASYAERYDALYESIKFEVTERTCLEYTQNKILDVFMKRITDWYSSVINLARVMAAAQLIDIKYTENVINESINTFDRQMRLSRTYCALIEEIFARQYRAAMESRKSGGIFYNITVIGSFMSIDDVEKRIKKHWNDECRELQAFLTYEYKIIRLALFQNEWPNASTSLVPQ